MDLESCWAHDQAQLDSWPRVLLNVEFAIHFQLLYDAQHASNEVPQDIVAFISRIETERFTQTNRFVRLRYSRGLLNALLHRRAISDAFLLVVYQLLLGTLLFTIVVFLMTTYIVFFAFFAIIRLQIRSIELFLWIIIGGIRCTSFGMILYRLWNPTFFAKSVHLNLSQNCTPDSTKTLDDSMRSSPDSRHSPIDSTKISDSRSTQKSSAIQPVFTIYSLEFSSTASISLFRLHIQKITEKLAAHLKNWEQISTFIFVPTGDIDLILDPIFEIGSYHHSEKAV